MIYSFYLIDSFDLLILYWDFDNIRVVEEVLLYFEEDFYYEQLQFNEIEQDRPQHPDSAEYFLFQGVL